MKIVIWSFFGAMRGGAEMHTAVLAATMAKRGHDVTFVGTVDETFQAMLNERAVALNEVRVEAPPTPRNGILDWLARLRQYAADVWIVPKGGIGSGSLALELASRLRFNRLVTIEHSTVFTLPPPKRLFGKIPRWGPWRIWIFSRYFIRSLGPTLIICVSEASRSRLLQDYLFSPRKTTAFRNGIDSTLFRADSRHRDATRKALGISLDARVFGAIGRLHEQKNYDLLIRAFKRLRDMKQSGNADLCLVLYGDGPANSNLRRLIEAEGLKSVVLLPGVTNRPWEIYPAFDFFAMPSQCEGLPLSLLEAMACECTPLATAVGGIPEVLNDSSLGWLVPANDEDAMFEAMLSSIRIAPEERRAMGQMARHRVEQCFDAKRQYAAVCEAIESIG